MRPTQRKSAEASEKKKRSFDKWQEEKGNREQERRREIKGRTVRGDDKNLKDWKRVKLGEKRQRRPERKIVPILFLQRDLYFFM